MVRRSNILWLYRKSISVFLVACIISFYILSTYEDAIRNMIINVRLMHATTFYIHVQVEEDVNCEAVFRGNQSEIYRARYLPHREMRDRYTGSLPDSNMNCDTFKHNRGYISEVSEEELSFPIAFSILTYKNLNQTERLLRAIYRPHNFYCIHVDATSPELIDDIKRLTKCFENVFMASRLVDVVWGEFSVLEADLICMKDLLAYTTWKYFINLTGQEFPLKTNYQLVQILKAFNGANNIGGTVKRYYENVRRWFWAGPPPHGLRPVMGSVHIAANRAFVEFAITSTVASDLRKWVKKTLVPDETFFQTLNYNPQLTIPGSFNGTPVNSEPFPLRFKNWDHGLLFLKDTCKGMYVREICILGVRDVASLVNQKHLFANKFHSDFEPAALDCLEEWYFNATVREHEGQMHFDTDEYSSLDFVKSQVFVMTKE